MSSRCRVFIRDIPSHVQGGELRRLLEEATTGCGEVMMLADPRAPKSHRGYALASYASFAQAVDATRRRVAVDGQPLRLNVVDPPRDGGPVSRHNNSASGTKLLGTFEGVYEATLSIDNIAVNKTDLCPTLGLTRALRGYCVPRWCKFSAQNLDCEFGEKCQFIHKKGIQTTVFPRKREREALLPEAVLFDDPEKANRMLSLTEEDVRDILRGVPSATLANRIDAAMAQIPSSSGSFVVALSTVTPTDGVLMQEVWTKDIAIAIDEAVVTVGLDAGREKRLNATLRTILQQVGERLAVKTGSEAVALLARSDRVRMAVQEPSVRLEIRPWYPLLQGLEFIIHVTNGKFVGAAAAYPYLYFPETLSLAAQIETILAKKVLESGGKIGTSTNFQQHVGVVREGDGRLTLRVLRTTNQYGPPIKWMGPAKLELCEGYPGKEKMLHEAPQNWLQFVHRHCTHR